MRLRIIGTFATFLLKSALGIELEPSESVFFGIFSFKGYFPLKFLLLLSKSGHMTKNGPIAKTKTVLESGGYTDHLSTMQNHPSTGLPDQSS